MNQFIKNKLRNAAQSSSLLGVASTLKVHLRKAVPFGKTLPINVQISELTNNFKIRTHGSDFEVCLQVFAERDYDLAWCEPYKAHIRQICDGVLSVGNIPLIIDAGANIGASTLLLAHAFPKCQIYAVEPDAGNFAMLELNTQELENVTAIRAGLWNKATNLAIQWEPGTGWAQRVEEKASVDKESIVGVTVQQLIERNPRNRPVIVKMDIEGAEVQVLSGDNSWVDQVPLVIFEAHDNLHHWLGMWKGSMHAFMSCLTRRKREYLSKGENVFAFLHS